MIITLKNTKNDLDVISVIVFTISVMISINEKHNNHKKKKLEAVVHRFLSIPHPLLHEKCLHFIGDTLRTLGMQWGLPNVPIIRFNSFSIRQMTH